MTKRSLKEEAPLDLGSEAELSQEEVDIIDEVISSIMDEVVANGFSEAAAEKKVRDAIEKLVKDEIISEVPEYDEPDGVKALWISNAVPSVTNHLRLKGDML